MPVIKVPNEINPETKLPPPGAARNEELAKRTDALQEAIETKMPEMVSLDPSKLEPDRELQYAMQEFSMHEVSDKLPGWKYTWVYSGQHGTEITMKKTYGWIVVQGNDVEAKELEHVDTTRRLGDCILMRIPEAKYKKLMEYEDYVRKLKSSAGDQELQDAAQKLGLQASFNEPRIIQRFGGGTPAQRIVMQGGGPVDRMLKEGTVPGMEIGR
ncbi:MAG: hypothetical protein WC390_08605 [Sulfurimonas sp.]|jgi:hypothetical protein